MGKLEVKSTAERTVKYDRISISVKFRSEGETASEASEKVMRDCDAFLGAMKIKGFDISEIMLYEDDVNEFVRYDEEDSIDKYKAFRAVEIIIEFDMKIINMIRAILNSLSFKAEVDTGFIISNEDQISEELMMEALKDTKLKAEKMAAAIGEEITGLISVGEMDTHKNTMAGDILCMDSFEVFEHEDSLELEEYLNSEELSAKEKTIRESAYTVWETRKIKHS